MAEAKKIRAVEAGRTIDLDIPFENDFEAGRWVTVTLPIGVSFRAHIVPRVGDHYVKAVDRVRRRHRVGKGRKPADMTALDAMEQRQIGREITATANFLAYETASGKPISVQGIECPSDTVVGRMKLLEAPMIAEAIEAAISSETEEALSGLKEDREEEERLSGN